MTEPQSTPVPDSEAPSWDEKFRAAVRQAEELLLVNKTALFDTLSASGIDTVTVVFDGYGDNGQIESVEAQAGDATVTLPSATVEIARAVWGSVEVNRQIEPVAEVIEMLAYDLLNQAHGGWENNDGAYGEFTFEVGPRTITLAYNERYMDSDFSQHLF
jgi:hypothetical protein